LEPAHGDIKSLLYKIKTYKSQKKMGCLKNCELQKNRWTVMV